MRRVQIGLLVVLLAACEKVEPIKPLSVSHTNKAEVKQVSQVSRDITKLYQRSCIACHGSGSGGAPVSFSPKAWQPRLKKGMPVLVNNVMKGMVGMPAMGYCTDCTEQEIEAMIRFMASPKP